MLRLCKGSHGFGTVSGRVIFAGALALAVLAQPSASHAKGFRVLHDFLSGSDGAYPSGALLRDAAGNLYGTTYYGGPSGNGTVYRIARDGSESVLYAFDGTPDGANPQAGLVMDLSGNLYGTTYGGGANEDGTVFKLAPDGTETVLFAFCDGCRDFSGSHPEAALVEDNAGNLYGTTAVGGNPCGGLGCGTVFKLAPNGKVTPLHQFAGGTDGALPVAGLILDGSGNLYGTTETGGGSGCDGAGCGTVFELTPDGTETVLYRFRGPRHGDSSSPAADLVMDGAGNLYGTTIGYGGGGRSLGAVFKLAPDGSESILYAFKGRRDGERPAAGLVRDVVGNLYGTTTGGGANYQGVVFMVAPGGSERVLHAFTGGNDGGIPWGGLAADGTGHLYGTADAGGADYGSVFRLDE